MSPKQELMSILNNQQTVSTKKLRRLLEGSFFSQVRDLKEHNKQIKWKMRQQQNELNRLYSERKSMRGNEG